MKIKINYMNAETYIKFNKYLGKKLNVATHPQGHTYLKVALKWIEDVVIERGSWHYSGVEVAVEDFRLTKLELNELMEMLYDCKESKKKEWYNSNNSLIF